MMQPFLIQNNTLFLTQVIDTELLIRGIKNMFYLFISIFTTILYLGLMLLTGIINLSYYVARFSINRWDYVISILVVLCLFINIISYFSNLNKKIEKDLERKLQQIYLLNEDNYYRINDLQRRLNKIE